jgi:hypothetical protein
MAKHMGMRAVRIGVVLAMVLLGRPAVAGVEADVEAGLVFASLNDARIPGNGGTMISLVNDLSTSPAPAFRLRLGYRIAQRHLLTALYANSVPVPVTFTFGRLRLRGSSSGTLANPATTRAVRGCRCPAGHRPAPRVVGKLGTGSGHFHFWSSSGPR